MESIKPKKVKVEKHSHVEKNFMPTSAKMSYEGQSVDIMLHAFSGRFTNWLSPASFGIAMFDWLAHLSIAPAKQLDLGIKAFRHALQLAIAHSPYAHHVNCLSCIETRPNDKRFENELWNNFPFSWYAQTFLAYEHWWGEATSTVRGVSRHHRQVVNFALRQMLDLISPTNFPWTNPEVLNKTIETNGANFFHGLNNFWEDCARNICELPPVGTEQFQIGENIAVTPGKVIYRNRLIELIQYTPTTAKVYAEPILIVPAWIMKYYILDLSPNNSLVKYLVNRGHAVFMISWKNPGSEDRDLSLEDYVDLGIMSAMEAINHIIPRQKIHTVGYCIGGTLLMMTAAAMANKSDDRLKSITLFAAQVDFKDPGELSLFIDQSQITYLEDIMWEKGYLDGAQMANAFSMLHSHDLIWSRMIHDYLLGTRRPMNDLVAWDHDTTRLPYQMHSEYLNELFLNNELSQGRLKLWHKRIALIDINTPIFAVSTLTDHVSPWKSVYKIHLFTDTEVTFVLTSGGHNAGIVSEPGHPHRTYQILTRKKGDRHIISETWQEKAPHFEGSWWIAWQKWLVEHSDKQTFAPPLGNPDKGYPVICDAPGTYVFRE